MRQSGHTVLLGGVGGDCHSVGLAILRQSLTATGYRVRFLGNQNSLEEFFRLAPQCNVVMISSLDGHARYYLEGFRDLLSKYPDVSALWYLGGNLTIGDALGYEQRFRDVGFHRVFVKFTDIRTVLRTLEADLANIEPVSEYSGLLNGNAPALPVSAREISDDMLTMDCFLENRTTALEQWHTGRAASDLRQNALYLSRVPHFPTRQAEVHRGLRRTLIQPRCGVARAQEQADLFKVYKSVGADTLSYQVDSLTRNNDYAGVAEAMRHTDPGADSTLNGFPLIHHGVPALRRIMAEVRSPIQTRHSTRHPELLAEISYAGGVTAFEGGSICYNIPYYKNYSLDESIVRWQYVDRLTGLYYEKYGIVLDREFFGVLTATLLPPCIAIVTNILESILAVRQGVKCLSVGYAEQGHRAQDIAALRVMREKTTATLANLGYSNVQVNTVFHQYMAAFPNDQKRAEELVMQSAATAAMCGATRVLIKTAAESFRIPTVQDNSFAIQLVRQGLALGYSTPVNEEAVEQECVMLRREVEQLLEGVVMCGRGVIAKGIVRAFEQGVLEIPFSPSIYNRGDVITARDAEGAVRFLATGKLPFDREIIDWHREAMSRRRVAEGIHSAKESYLLVEKDVMRVPRGEYSGWPLSA